jgi:hypothetical protein
MARPLLPEAPFEVKPMRTTPLLSALGVALLLSAAAAAQCPPPSWTGINRIPGFNLLGSTSASTLWDQDGGGPLPAVLVAGGNFQYVHDTAARSVAAWDGTAWRPIGNEISGSVSALAVYNGELIAGGWFTLPGFSAGPNLARFDGTTWQPLGPISDPANPYAGVRSLAVYDGELVVGGDFAMAGAVAANRIARWNGTICRRSPAACRNRRGHPSSPSWRMAATCTPEASSTPRVESSSIPSRAGTGARGTRWGRV